MRRRTVVWASGAVLVCVAAACGGDGGSNGSPGSNAGTSGDAGQPSSAGTGNDASDGGGEGLAQAGDTAVGGSGAAPSGGDAGAGGVAGAMNEPSTDVSGDVFEGNVPLANAVVLVGDVKTKTDAAGHFSVPAVADEYSLTILAQAAKLVWVYDGIKTRTPHVVVEIYHDDPDHSEANIKGMLKGGVATPVPGGVRVDNVVGYQSFNPGHTVGAQVNAGNPFNLWPQWYGSGTDQGSLWAIQVRMVGGFPAEFTGFGRKDLTIEDGGAYGSALGSSATDIDLIDPPDFTLKGKLEVAAGWEWNYSYLMIGPIVEETPLMIGDFSLVVPKLEVPYDVELSLAGTDHFAIIDLPVPAKGPWDIKIPDPPQLSAPADDATGVNGATPFSWQGMPDGAIADVVWNFGDWYIQRFTAANHATIPDISKVGVQLPGNIAGSVSVRAMGPAATPEDVLAQGQLHALQHGQASWFYQGHVVQFTTAP